LRIIHQVFKQDLMNNGWRFVKLFCVVALGFMAVGCATVPANFLKPSEGYLEKRQLQIRQYDTTNETQFITAVAGVLQDLGFTLDDSETSLGFISASKKADATSGTQMASAVFLDMLGAFGGSYANNTARCDKTQVVKASVIVRPSLEGKKVVVRITLQRLVWNMSNQLSRVETVSEPEIYQKFYDGLSKAIFLEAQKI
jgi:hypothetical protein